MKYSIVISLLLISFYSFAQEGIEQEKTEAIYQESAPEFPGGMHEFYLYVSRETKKIRNGAQGSVFVQFEIDSTGYVIPENVIVTKSLSKYTDAEAIRVLKKCPKWKPGYQNNKPIRITLTLPITFRNF